MIVILYVSIDIIQGKIEFRRVIYRPRHRERYPPTWGSIHVARDIWEPKQIIH